jgi:putative redox protein
MIIKTAIVKQVSGVTLVAKGDSNHWVVIDGAPSLGGSEAGSSPKELLLFALGGCTAFDVIDILRKKRAPVENVEIKLTGDAREEHPQVFTKIHLEYVIYGEGVKNTDVERAIELSTTKYCSVHAMLAPGVPITHSYKIIESKDPISIN